MMLLPAAKLWLYALALARLSGVMLIAPVFSSMAVNRRLKLAILVIFALFVASVLPAQPTPSGGFMAILPAVALEFVVGLLMGTGFFLAMSAMSIAGEIMGLQMGLGSASLFDPNNGASEAVLSSFFVTLFAVMFISLDGHHHLLRIFLDSYTTVPAGSASLQPACLQLLLDQSGEMLATGCRLAAPVLIPLFLVTFTTALISRAFPQANVVALTYGICSLLGLFLLAATMPVFQQVIQESIHGADRGALKMLEALAGGG